MASRFVSATDGEIDEILSARDSKNTKIVVKTTENVLNEYFKETSGISIDEVKEKPSEEICDVLRKFYCGARKKYGSTYAKTTMISMRYVLQK